MSPKVALCHFCEIHGPSLVFYTSIYPPDSVIRPLTDLTKDTDCEGCSFQSRGSEGFACVDPESGNKFVSCATVPEGSNSAQLRSNLQQACVRSLSCEVCPDGREGIIYFGDEDRGHVLSHCFVLKDSQARGFTRTYSVIFITEDKTTLLRNWNSIVSNVQAIINRLKSDSDSIHDREVKLTTNKERRSIRLESAMQVAGRTAFNTQRSQSKARSLIELTGRDTIFVSLHLDFVTLLKNYEIGAITLRNEVSPSPPSEETNSSLLRNLYAILGSYFKTIAYHLVIGHQVIVRCKNVTLANQVVTLLAELLPNELTRLAIDASKYFDDSSCNLVSISDTVRVGDGIAMSERHLLVDIVVKDPEDVVVEAINLSQPTNSRQWPSYVVNVERMIQDTSYSDECLSVFVGASQKQVLDKCKMAESLLSTGHLTLASALSIIDVNEADAPVIEFWMSHNDYAEESLDGDSHHFDSSQERSVHEVTS